jgi:hypothetical protein
MVFWLSLGSVIGVQVHTLIQESAHRLHQAIDKLDQEIFGSLAESIVKESKVFDLKYSLLNENEDEILKTAREIKSELASLSPTLLGSSIFSRLTKSGKRDIRSVLVSIDEVIYISNTVYLANLINTPNVLTVVSEAEIVNSATWDLTRAGAHILKSLSSSALIFTQSIDPRAGIFRYGIKTGTLQRFISRIVSTALQVKEELVKQNTSVTSALEPFESYLNPDCELANSLKHIRLKMVTIITRIIQASKRFFGSKALQFFCGVHTISFASLFSSTYREQDVRANADMLEEVYLLAEEFHLLSGESRRLAKIVLLTSTLRIEEPYKTMKISTAPYASVAKELMKPSTWELALTAFIFSVWQDG